MVNSHMDLHFMSLSCFSLLTHSIIAGIIYLILLGGRPVEAQSQEIMGTRPSMENLNGMLFYSTSTIVIPHTA